ncbi:MAG TPA: diguanylate cyclase [Gallionella sp.]|nr:diguanylate cyclase [Gallionella sp.]
MGIHQELPQDISRRLRLLNVLEQITQVSLASESMEDMMSGVLDLVLDIFGADRAWFLYPCDPGAPSWHVPMERTLPEWPGLFTLGVEMPMTGDVAGIFGDLLGSDSTIQFGPHTDHPIPPFVVEKFSVKSQLHIALRPKIGNAWVFGLHHCASEVIHDEEDLRLFQDIAHRISDTLSSLISVRQLRESEAKFRTLYDSTSDAVMLLGEHGFIDCNKATLAIFGCATLEEFCSKHPADYSPREQPCGTDSMALSKQQIATAMENGSHYFEWVHARADTGRNFPAEVLLSVMELDGKPVIQATVRDITERKHAERQLHIAATAFETQEGILISDADNVILRVNRAFTDITGYAAEEVIGKNPRILSSGRHDANFYAEMWRDIQRTGGWSGEIWNRRKNGEVYPEHLTITAVKDRNGIVTNYVATIADFTMSKAAEEKIKNLAFYDPLTSLPNRRLLADRLEHALASSARSGKVGALLFIDLDNFKILNDTFGHDTGDLLLQQVAQRLVSCVRDGDTVARLGGDEFVVILETLNENALESAAQAETVGQKILAALDQPYRLAGQVCRCSSSIGVTLFNGHQTAAEELLKQADTAMYLAKNAGRNALRFFDWKIR